jgi:hypothetical protein
LDESYRAKEELEAKLRARVCELEMKLNDSYRKELEVAAILLGRVCELSSKLEESDRNKEEVVEATLRDEMKTMRAQIDKMNFESEQSKLTWQKI